MMPMELRRFRESLGLSRKRFARILLVSEPTLVRWENGQGGPRTIHLSIIERLHAARAAGRGQNYFVYDDVPESVARDPIGDARRMFIATLDGLDSVLLREETKDNGDWSMCFRLAWGDRGVLEATWACHGSERPDRPAIDCTAHIAIDADEVSVSPMDLLRPCFDHGISALLETDSTGPTVLKLRQRLFTVNCNPDAVFHLVGNARSCWQRLLAEVAPAAAVGNNRTRG